LLVLKQIQTLSETFLDHQTIKTNDKFQKEATPSVSNDNEVDEAVLILNENSKCLTIPEQSASHDNTTKHK